MKKFDVQGVDLHTTREMAFSYIADPMHFTAVDECICISCRRKGGDANT